MDNIIKGCRTKKLEGLVVVVLCVCALMPFLRYTKSAQRFFWFGDELHLLLELRDQGMIRWAFNTFAENFVPLFKLLWGSLVWVLNGSYFGMLSVVWTTHVITVVTLYLTLRAACIGRLPAFAASATLAVAWSNIETLMWTVQWSAMLSILLFLAAVKVYLGFSPEQTTKRSLYQLMWVFILAGGATLCFSKGVINALGLSMAILVMAAVVPKGRRWNVAFACAVIFSALAVASLIFVNSTGNHHKLSGGHADVLIQMAEYGLYYFSCNPLAALVRHSIPSNGDLGALGVLFVVKCLCIGYGLASTYRLEQKKTFFFLIVCVFVDILTSFFIGVGRFHEGIQNTISSRYQYSSLVSFAPFLWIALDRLFDALLRIARLHGLRWMPLIKVAALIFFLFKIYGPWESQMREWSYWRGTQGRKLFFKGELDPKRPPQYGVWIGLPPIVTLEQGHMLVKEYNLH